jgi:hypothetical protein
MVISLPGSLVAFGERFVVELSLAILFVTPFVVTTAGDWAGFFWLPVVVTAAVVLSLPYLVLLRMVHRHAGKRSQGHRADGTNELTARS